MLLITIYQPQTVLKLSEHICHSYLTVKMWVCVSIANNVDYQKVSLGNLNSLCEINDGELHSITLQWKSSFYSLDAIPPILFKVVLDSLICHVLDDTNCSLETVNFPDAVKTVLVKLLLGKHYRDSCVLSNSRPISNLSYLKKILEKVIVKRLDVFLYDSTYKSNQWS